MYNNSLNKAIVDIRLRPRCPYIYMYISFFGNVHRYHHRYYRNDDDSVVRLRNSSH